MSQSWQMKETRPDQTRPAGRTTNASAFRAPDGIHKTGLERRRLGDALVIRELLGPCTPPETRWLDDPMTCLQCHPFAQHASQLDDRRIKRKPCWHVRPVIAARGRGSLAGGNITIRQRTPIDKALPSRPQVPLRWPTGSGSFSSHAHPLAWEADQLGYQQANRAGGGG